MSAGGLSSASHDRGERDLAGGDVAVGLAGTTGDEAGAMDRALVGPCLRGLIHRDWLLLRCPCSGTPMPLTVEPPAAPTHRQVPTAIYVIRRRTPVGLLTAPRSQVWLAMPRFRPQATGR